MKANRAFIRQIVTSLGLPALLVLAWLIFSAGSQNIFFPPLSRILQAFAKVWFSAKIVDDVVPSIIRLIIGYVAAVALGLAFGIWIGSSRIIRNFLEPTLEFLRAIPPPVMVPIFMLFAGIGDLMKIWVIVSGCVWPVLLNTVEGVRALDEVMANVMRSFRISPARRLWHFVLPGSSPQIFAGMRQALSIGIILMVISEMFAASNGLGFTLIQFQRGFAIPEMWSGVILLGLIGIALAFIFRFIENWVLAWYFGLRRTQREGA
jgi:ABC-type nitrate/sulfonate/bicarbonate transport system permease component